MPIYLGATYRHMADGAAHLSQTSLPIGGENTNCVIAGHRGWGGASYFRYITELEAGDEVIITNLWGELRYTVVETKIIDPNDVKEILIQEGRELLTFFNAVPLYRKPWPMHHLQRKHCTMNSGMNAPSQTATMHHDQRSMRTIRRGVFTYRKNGSHTSNRYYLL